MNTFIARDLASLGLDIPEPIAAAEAVAEALRGVPLTAVALVDALVADVAAKTGRGAK